MRIATVVRRDGGVEVRLQQVASWQNAVVRVNYASSGVANGRGMGGNLRVNDVSVASNLSVASVLNKLLLPLLGYRC